MAWLLIGAAIGLALAGTQIPRYIRRLREQLANDLDHDRPLNDPEPPDDLECAIPEWVNRGQGIWLHPTIDEFIDAVNALTREQQIKDSARWN